MGYDLEHFVGDVAESLLCKVCSKVLQEPFKCSRCGALACSRCWVYKEGGAERSGEGEEKPICPNCKGEAAATGSDDAIVADIVEKVGALSVHCPQHSSGCEAVLQLADLREHVVSQCQHTQLVCPHDGCTDRLDRVGYEEHVTYSCEFRLVACAACGTKLTQRDLCTHQQQGSCFYQLQRRRLVLAQKDVAQDLRDHRIALQLARRSTEQAERRVIKEHFQRQQKQLRRTNSAPAVRLSLDRGILGPLGLFRIGSATPHFSRNMHSVTATPMSPRGIGLGRPEKLMRPSSCRQCSARFLPTKNHATACNFHKGPMVSQFGGTCTNCGRWRTVDGCRTGWHAK